MAASSQTVEQTLTEVGAWRPVLEPVLRVFEPIMAAQAELAAELAKNMAGSEPALPEWQADRAAQGVSLLAGAKLSGIAGPMRASAEKLLPILGKIEVLTPHISALSAYFLQEDEADKREALAEAVLADDSEAVSRIAAANGLDPMILGFAAAFVVAPVIRAMLLKGLDDKEEAWWDESGWAHGYCPVCGSLPTVGWLDKPSIDEKNAYLAGGGGKKHLHCGLCGANWKFRRGACPSCGEEGNGVIEMLRESGAAHGERLDWCTKCKAYCPTVDLREREFTPDLDAAALGMMHLDMVAARKELRPLRPSFWNLF